MNNPKPQKLLLLTKLKEIIDEKITLLKSSIEIIEESRNNETKSSVGDKYETGRAMMQNELEKNKIQLLNAITLQNQLNQIDINKYSKIVTLGCLTITSQGKYFISIGLGKIESNNDIFYAISLDSPLGQVLKGKMVGDSPMFKGKIIEILAIS